MRGNMYISFKNGQTTETTYHIQHICYKFLVDKSSWYNHLQEIYFLNVNASCLTYIQSLKSLVFTFQMKQKNERICLQVWNYSQELQMFSVNKCKYIPFFQIWKHDVCYITKRITRLLWYESDTNSVDLIVDDCRHCASFIIIQGRKPVICLGLDIFPQTNDLLQIYYRLSFEPITDLPLQCSLCTVT